MTDQDVRDMLRRRAGDVTPADDAWEQIVERIDGGAAAPVVELAPPRRWFSSPPVLLGAAAAALVLVVATGTLLRGGGDTETLGAADRPASATTTTAADPTTTTSVPAAVAAPTFESAAEQAARAWVDAIGAGNLAQAWDLLGDQSRQAIGGRSGFDASRTGLAEGWGAWSNVPGVSYRAVLLLGGTSNPPAALPQIGVVTLSGVVAQEGADAFRSHSLAVRGTVGALRVEPFAETGIELQPAPEPLGGAGVAGGTRLGAYTPAAAKVWFLLDDRSPADPGAVEGADGDQQLATFTPTPALTSGRHVLTVAALMANGHLLTRSSVYTVSADAPQPVLQCGMVAFTSASEDAASDITVAGGSSCDAARALVEVAGRQTSSGGPDEVVVQGYRCTRTGTAQDPLPTSTYRCTKGTTVITYVRS